MENIKKRKIFSLIYWIIAAVIGVAGIKYFLSLSIKLFYKSLDRWLEFWFDSIGHHYPFNILDFITMALVYMCATVLIYKAITQKKKAGSIILSILLILTLFFQLVSNGFGLDYLHNQIQCAGKAPVIYLYPEEEIDAVVEVDLNGEFTCTYPKYSDDGWQVTASPDGSLVDDTGRTYDFLYWEGNFTMEPDLSKGFCVKGEDSAKFLEEALATLGLNDSEANTFIMYWLPILEKNEYNVITFQTDAYEEAAKLNITPEPDNIIRVNMYFYGSDEYVEIEPQDLASINNTDRSGFTVVEWGGEEMGVLN